MVLAAFAQANEYISGACAHAPLMYSLRDVVLLFVFCFLNGAIDSFLGFVLSLSKCNVYTE